MYSHVVKKLPAVLSDTQIVHRRCIFSTTSLLLEWREWADSQKNSVEGGENRENRTDYFKINKSLSSWDQFILSLCSSSFWPFLQSPFSCTCKFVSITQLPMFILIRYYTHTNKKWSKRGLPGPTPELVLGNLREVWDYDRPRSIVMRDWSKKYGKVHIRYLWIHGGSSCRCTDSTRDNALSSSLRTSTWSMKLLSNNKRISQRER